MSIMSLKGANSSFHRDREEEEDSLPAELKCEDENNEPKCLPSSELYTATDNFSFPSCSIKQEPEDSRKDDFQQVRAENEVFKEEIDIEEHEPGWELTGGGNVGIFSGGLGQCGAGQENDLHCSENSLEADVQYNCAHCLFKTNCKSIFIQHYKRKHARVYKCQECAYETGRKDHLILHFKSKHSKDAELYKCQECSYYETKYKYNLTSHYKMKHSKEAEMYKCAKCSYETRYKYNLPKHNKIKHAKDAAEVYKCKECSFETKYKYYIDRHYKYKHVKEAEMLKCSECSFKAGVKHYLAKHYKNKHSKDGKVYK